MIVRFLAAVTCERGPAEPFIELQMLRGDAFALSARASPHPEPYGAGVNSELNSRWTGIGRDRAAVDPVTLLPIGHGPFGEKDGADENGRRQGRDRSAGAKTAGKAAAIMVMMLLLRAGMAVFMRAWLIECRACGGETHSAGADKRENAENRHNSL